MQSIATLAPIAAQQFDEVAPPSGVSPSVKNLFLLLQGSYGSQFLSKFSTGVMDPTGKRDLGIRAAMVVWDQALARFPAPVLEDAARRVRQEHTDFPPNLAQVEVLCEACMPRQTYAEENNLPRLAAPAPVAPVVVSFAQHNDGKDWARRLLAREAAGETLKPIQQRFAREALRMSATQKGGVA